MARLADHEIGKQALAAPDLLRDVLSIKETFYRTSFSNYDLCASGGLRLVPDSSLLEPLQQDYNSMLSAQMFYGDTLSFTAIMERLRQLEAEINRTPYP